MGFNSIKKFEGLTQSIGIGCGTVIFRQAIYGEGNGIELFAGVKRTTIRGRNRPEYTTMKAVDEMGAYIVIGTLPIQPSGIGCEPICG